MLSFASDYIAGAHPKVLQHLVETNLENLPGYGSDTYTDQAAHKIRTACECPDAQVQFLAGGTQANQFVISTGIAPYQGVIAAATGHVSIHEAGAIEYSGHKVLEIPGTNGKLAADDVRTWLDTFWADGNHQQMVMPGMVYISQPTEYGTIYSKAELEALYGVCQDYRIPLFIDGARLGYALASPSNDVTLPELAHLCDVFYIGGTKVGTLCGEAVVYTHLNAPENLITQVRQHGALLAKGRLLSVQFDALFTDGLYLEIGKHGIEMAEKLKALFTDRGYDFFLESPTNQQFIIMDNAKMRELAQEVEFSFWEKYDDEHTVVRFATSWSTTQEDIDGLAAIL
ncbi:MAG: aminotransferase class I/II-fold pyridoxal phosphate-dependent enzyme [Actinomycetaceae bacterium]|nr:aminotransferase class I/II-fold pyridoxal phosphate-dependent enzyme [Actinomycetaceae bacterium]MDY6082629.1 aminotransferase class I/II-fold pyridoxal phosphate-dependent enzyme [Actinomycetaceae bacterium]